MSMAKLQNLLFDSIVVCFLIFPAYAEVLFSTLPRSLVVTASPKEGQVLKAGVDKITVTWRLNQTLSSGKDSTYKSIKVKICYAPISQADRAWRKTVDNLKKDKTCQFNIVTKPYNSANKTTQSYEWVVERDVPTATYFVRAYALNSDGVEVGYGQSTDSHKKTNLFEVNSITGRHVTLDICSVCFSAFSVVALFVLFFNEKRKGKRSQQK